MTSFFHSYDLRGKYPEEIGKKEAKKVGKAYGTFIGADKVLIGRDGRIHAEKITKAFIEGILSTGTDVEYAGKVPSPVIYYGQVENSFKSAAVVTASHNPSEYTGFKFNLENAQAMSREAGMKEIEEIYGQENFESGEGEKHEIDLKEDYIDEIAGEIGELSQNILINCGNGVTGVIARDLFEEIGCEVDTINETVDGSFPNHLADPGSEEARETIKENMEDDQIGIIFDGDGDRAGFVLPEYGYIAEDEILALFSREALENRRGKVVYDLRASKLVIEQIKDRGGTPIESRVGHTFISEMIHDDEEIVFAGELSGHYYFPAHQFPWDDGLFAAALLLKVDSQESLQKRLANFKNYPVSPELRIDCPHKAKKPVIEDIKEKFSEFDLTTKDGVKITFENGWALVRPSNTEEKMSVRCEAETQKDLDEILQKVEQKVKKSIEINS